MDPAGAAVAGTGAVRIEISTVGDRIGVVGAVALAPEHRLSPARVRQLPGGPDGTATPGSGPAT